MSRATLINIAADALQRTDKHCAPQAADVLEVPAAHYYDPDRWQQEKLRVFSRFPLVLATSAELPRFGDYKAMQAGDTPVLITRDEGGLIRAFINSCAHRGAQIMPEGRGSAKRFTCPYHAWSYNPGGELTHIYREAEFGDIEKSEHGLVPLRCTERAGLIWVFTDPAATLEFDAFLCGYDEVLAQFNLAAWHWFDENRLAGPNWKIAYDGYLDFYHLPILHKATFGADAYSRAAYYDWGPHQHVKSPENLAEQLGELPEAQWPTPFLLSGVWTIFPHVSIASFGEQGSDRGVLISQLFPGDRPEDSYTLQQYLLESPPDEERAAAAREQFEFLKFVVAEEDYATGLRQQQALKTGARKSVLFGRNEAGGQRFHHWLDRILETEDQDLNSLF